MNERGDSGPAIGVAGLDGLSAGAMLRAAREKRGLHIAALAASMKISPRKLEALEGDRHAELPDLTFTRALAQSVCRALKTDAEPILAKLPHAGDLPKLAQVGSGLNAPFRAAPGGRDPADFTFHRRPVFWATLLILLGALALAFLPEIWMPWRGASLAAGKLLAPATALKAGAPVSMPSALTAAAATAAAAVAEPATAQARAPVADSVATAATPGMVIETVHSAPPPSLSSPAVATTAMLALRTSADSWIDVQDGRGQSLLSRNVQPGETVGLDGALPLRLTIGNAAATQLTFRGQAVDLSASTRDNVARLQLPQR